MKAIFLWLFVINLGIACGAGLYEARVVIPQWADIPPKNWPNTGLKFWVYVTTIPLTVLTMANLIAAWRDSSTRRKWWLGAAVMVLLERIVTFSYFIPTMIRLMGSELPETEVKAALSQWLLFNHGRHVLTLSGWLMALKALSLAGDRYKTVSPVNT
ncbi:MAG: anthrone oxygenase family protein [Candidatus Binatia bacterium]